MDPLNIHGLVDAVRHIAYGIVGLVFAVMVIIAAREWATQERD